jgi:hypothetical protein
MNLELNDDSELWLIELLEHHHEEARQRALSLIAEGQVQKIGCITTDTQGARKVRFRGRQVPAYRFIYCVLTGTVAGYDDVVRHRCNNRLCINPDHLTIGSRADNKRDDWGFAADGVDFDLL